MNHYYRFHSYIDTYTTSDFDRKESTNVDVCLMFNQIMPKSFELPLFDLFDRYDSYFLTFSITFKFILENNQLSFQKFRFSISGSDTKFDSRKDFEHLPDHVTFKEFIHSHASEFVDKHHPVISDNISYHINNHDHQKIINGLGYIHKIFPNEKDIVIVDEPGGDFYQASGSGFKDGVVLYEKSRTFLAFEALQDKLKERKSVKIKSHKI